MPATTLAELLKTIGDKNYFTGDWKEWDNLTEEEKEKYDSSSGMGGELNIMTFDQMYEGPIFPVTKDICLLKKYTLYDFLILLKN